MVEPSMEDMWRILRNKDKQLANQAQQIKALKDSLRGKKLTYTWALLQALGEEHLRCQECGSATSPRKNGVSGFVFMGCVKCDWTIRIKKKKRTHNAYE